MDKPRPKPKKSTTPPKLSNGAIAGIAVGIIVFVIIVIVLGVVLGAAAAASFIPFASSQSIASFSSIFASSGSSSSSSVSSIVSSSVAVSSISSGSLPASSQSIFSLNQCQILLALEVNGTNINFGVPVNVVGPFNTVVPSGYDPTTASDIGFIGINAIDTPLIIVANHMAGVFPVYAAQILSTGAFALYSMNFFMFRFDPSLPNLDPFLITASCFRFNSNAGNQVASVPIVTPVGTVPTDLIVLAQNGLNPNNGFDVIRGRASTASNLLIDIENAGLGPANLNYIVMRKTNNLNPNPFNSSVLYANPHTITIIGGNNQVLITLLTAVTGIFVQPVWFAMSADAGIQTIMRVTAIRPVSTTQVLINYRSAVPGLATFFVVCLQNSGQQVSNPPSPTTFGIQ